MNCTEQTYERGARFCRPADWKDVMRFFFLNFGLHAITVITQPGSSGLITAYTTFVSLLMPSAGVDHALGILSRCAILYPTDLEVALKSGALCMLVPSDPYYEPPAETGADSGAESKEPTETITPAQSPSVTGDTREEIVSITDTSLKLEAGGSPRQTQQEISSPNGQGNDRRSNNNSKSDPWESCIRKSFRPVIPLYTSVHGQYPSRTKIPGHVRARRTTRSEKTRDLERSGTVGMGGPVLWSWLLPITPGLGGFSTGGQESQGHNSVAGSEESNLVDPPLSTNYSLIYVPKNFVVRPWVPHASPKTKGQRIRSLLGKAQRLVKGQTKNESNKTTDKITSSKLSSNLSLIKTCSGIFQIFYASFQLYEAGKGQIGQYGYAAYSLTVAPYIIMSLTNLLASLSAPRYPAMFIVEYGGEVAPKNGGGEDVGMSEVGEKFPPGWWNEEARKEIREKVSGTVGKVYGKFPLKDEGKSQEVKVPTLQSRYKRMIITVLCSILPFLAAAALASPYVITQLLTGYEKQSSTYSQRSWLTSWIVIGQVGPPIAAAIRFSLNNHGTVIARHPIRSLLVNTVLVACLSISTWGGFVMIGGMIVNDRVCSAI